MPLTNMNDAKRWLAELDAGGPDAQIEAARDFLAAYDNSPGPGDWELVQRVLVEAPVLLRALLWIVEAREKENAALREVVAALAGPESPEGWISVWSDRSYECLYCEARHEQGADVLTHTPDCPVARARALVEGGE